MTTFANTQRLLERAYAVIPSASQTFSKGPNQWVRGVSPHFLQRGEGAWVWDVDGNKYLDYLMALGPIILGYNNARVNAAIVKQLSEGTVFSQMHPLEVEVAELLVDLIPCAEMVRFGKNGSDVTSAAVRVARAYTGRERVVAVGYHGWHDWYIATTTRNKGVPRAVQDLSHTVPYNDLEALSALFNAYPGEVACVVMEPVGVEDPKPSYLQGVKDLCEKHGVVLVFDEIVSGFRMSLQGAQGYYGVTPHLACFGKAMANGMPLAAVVGRRDIMEVYDQIFFSGTFGGETLSLAACKATIEELRETKGLDHIWSFGQQFVDMVRGLLERHGISDAAKLLGFPPRSVLAFPHADQQEGLLRRSYFMQECVKRGLLYFCSHIPCTAHGPAELEFTRRVFEEVVPLFAAALHANDFAARMEGLPVEPIFRKA